MNLENSLKILLEVSSSNDAQILAAVAKLMKAFDRNFYFSPQYQSPVYSKQQELGIDLKTIQGLSEKLMQSRLPEFRSLGYKMLFFVYTSRPCQEILTQLLLHLSHGLDSVQVEGKRNLLKFLQIEVKRFFSSLQEGKFQEVFRCAGSMASEADPMPVAQKKLWLRTLACSGNSSLCEGACFAFARLYEGTGLRTLEDFAHLRDLMEALSAYTKPSLKVIETVNTLANPIETFDLEQNWVPQVYMRIVSWMMLHQKQEYAAELLINAARRGILKPSCNGLSTLWLHVCDEIYHGKEKGFEGALRLWREGHALKIWTNRPDVTDHRGFLVAFIEELYASKQSSNLAMAHEALDFVPQNSYKDNLTQRIETLIAIREEKIREERQSHESLQARRQEIEATLKSEPHYSRNEKLKKQLFDLLRSLSQTVSDQNIQAENLMHAHSLCTAPKVYQMLMDSDGTFLDLLTSFLENAYSLIYFKQQHSLIWDFIETACRTHFTFSERSLANPQTVRFIKMLVKIMNHKELGEISSKTFMEIQGQFHKLFRILKHLEDAKSTCALAYVLVNKTLGKTFSQDEFLEHVLWGVLKIISSAVPGTKDKKVIECLHILEHIQIKHDPNKPHELFDGCLILIKRLIELKLFSETGKWIAIMANTSNDIEAIDETVLSTLFDFAEILFKEKQLESAAIAITALVRHSNSINDPLFQNLVERSDEFFLLKPLEFTQLLIGHPQSPSDAPRISLAQKINVLARAMIKETNPDPALKLFERYNMPLNKPFEELLYSIAGTSQMELKLRAWEHYKSREEAVALSLSRLGNKSNSRKCVRCWMGAIKVLSTINSERRGWGYDLGVGTSIRQDFR